MNSDEPIHAGPSIVRPRLRHWPPILGVLGLAALFGCQAMPRRMEDSRSRITRIETLDRSPLAPASGERGRGEGASASRDFALRIVFHRVKTSRFPERLPLDHSPPLPNPLPRGGGEGTDLLAVSSFETASEPPPLLGDVSPVTVGELQQIAQSHSPTLRQAQALVRQAEGNFRQVGLHPESEVASAAGRQ